MGFMTSNTGSSNGIFVILALDTSDKDIEDVMNCSQTFSESNQGSLTKQGKIENTNLEVDTKNSKMFTEGTGDSLTEDGRSHTRNLETDLKDSKTLPLDAVM